MGVSDTTERDWEEHWYSEQLEGAYQKGREDAINECIKVNHIAWERHINDYSLGQKRRGQLNAMFVGILDMLEKLKEKK